MRILLFPSLSSQDNSQLYSLSERLLLQNGLPAWRAAKEQGGSNAVVQGLRREIVEALFDKIRRQRGSLTLAQKNALWNSIRLWLANHGRREGLLTKKRWTTRWYPRSVITELKKREIAEFIAARSTMMPGSAGYLADYQNHVTEYIKTEVSEHEMGVAKEIAKKWNEESPPEDVQARNARTKAHRVIFRFLRELHIQYGMVAVLLSAHKDGDDVVTGTYDFTKDFKPHLYLTKEYPKWSDEAMGHIEDFARTVFESEKVQEPKGPQKKFDLPIGPNGYPRLPPRRPRILKEMQFLLRDFLTTCYRFVVGDPFARVPWEAIEQNIKSFVEAIYLPPNERLVSPMRMHQRTIGIFFDFLYKRQEELNCAIVFTFKAYKSGKGPRAGVVGIKTATSNAAGHDSDEQGDEPDSAAPATVGTRTKHAKGRKGKKNEAEKRRPGPGPGRNSTGFQAATGSAAGHDDDVQDDEPDSPAPAMIGTRMRRAKGRKGKESEAEKSQPGPGRNSTEFQGQPTAQLLRTTTNVDFEAATGDAAGHDDDVQDDEPDSPAPAMIGTRVKRAKGRKGKESEAEKSHPGPGRNSTRFQAATGNAAGHDDDVQDDEPHGPAPTVDRTRAKGAKERKEREAEKSRPGPSGNSEGSLSSRSPSPVDELPQANRAKPPKRQAPSRRAGLKRIINPTRAPDGGSYGYTPTRIPITEEDDSDEEDIPVPGKRQRKGQAGPAGRKKPRV
ncbi:hypothetical protein BDN72DRAFT_904200 [Pluteus cervinus]|uniref:Uncharacterized protein n=1 Tax=Pluteus cervinus TaxID=181527 RepID=A0ACD3A6Q3_9AGAR|nr:hypothetical protein BDN72DRAFT_904200 [Pluteus cervinus]